jgi:hypothetical protein
MWPWRCDNVLNILHYEGRAMICALPALTQRQFTQRRCTEFMETRGCRKHQFNGRLLPQAASAEVQCLH